MSEVLTALQRVVKSSMSATPLLDLVDGTVLSPPPGITVRLQNTDLILDADDLIIDESLLPHDIEFTSELAELESRTDESSPYQPIQIRGTLRSTKTLQEGDSVLMVSFAEGQRYYILGRGVSYGSDV